MQLLNIFNGDQPLFIEENNKKYKKNLNEINKLINQFCVKYNEYSDFLSSNAHKENISLAKGLNEFFNSKRLRLDLVLDTLKKSDNAKISEFNAIKTKLLSELNIIRNPIEAVVCSFNLEGIEFTPCESGKEVVILGEHNNIIGNIIAIIENLSLEIDFESIEPHQASFNTSTLDSNLAVCRNKAEEVYASKQGRLNKVMEIIDKLQEVGEKVVSFYTYKERLANIGCNPKSIKDYENEVEKMYIPLKKTLQKELRVELQDICEIPANESDYHPTNEPPLSDADLDRTLELSQESPFEEIQVINDISQMFDSNNNEE